MAIPDFIVFIFLALDGVSALVPGLSAQTSAVSQPSSTNAGFPGTTKGPEVDLRRWGAIGSNELFARQETGNTCGYFSGDGNSPLVCGVSSGCWTWTNTLSPWNLWCCPYTTLATDTHRAVFLSTLCPYKMQCVTAGDGSNPNTDSTGTVISDTLYCPTSYPLCQTTRKVQADGQKMDLLQCGDEAGGLVTISDTSTEAPSPSISILVSVSETTVRNNATSAESSTTTTEPTSSSPSTAAGSSTGDSTTNQVPSTTSAGPTSSKSSGDSTPTGAIAGGVVGGVAGIALIGAAIGWLVWRKKSARVKATREVSQYGGSTY